MSDLEKLALAVPENLRGPWRWQYSHEGVEYQTRTETGWLIERRDVDTDVPDGDLDRGLMGVISLRGMAGTSPILPEFPDHPAILLHIDDDIEAPIARWLAAASPSAVLGMRKAIVAEIRIELSKALVARTGSSLVGIPTMEKILDEVAAR